MRKKDNIENMLEQVTEYFSPLVIAEVNDIYVKVAKINGDKIPWHNHQNEDEMFLILKGELLFETENQAPFVMKEGDFFVVQRGVEHRVSSDQECQILLIENKSTEHTGAVISEITRTISEQLDSYSRD